MTKPEQIVIVGGVAGGASAATRIRRLDEDVEILLFERGRHVSFANCGLPYHIGGVIEEREALLVQTPEGLGSRFEIEVRIQAEVVRIDREKKEVLTRHLPSGREETVPYDALILSPGAAPIRPPIPGIDSERIMTLRNMEDMDRINDVLQGKSSPRAVVVGGGYIGLEMAEVLRHRGAEVVLVELMDQVMGPADPEMAAFLDQELVTRGVDLRLGISADGFREAGDGLQVDLSDGETLEADLVVLAIGVRPEVDLARDAGIEIGPTGGILVDGAMRTSDPSVYAVGDAVEVVDYVSGKPALIPLAGPANRQGRIAADAIFGRESVYSGTQGTAICKVFDQAIGMTGLSEKAARKAGIPCEKIYIHPNSHAGYYPGAQRIHLKLIFNPDSGKILGAQAVGVDGIDKRIDVLATAIRAGMTVYDLEDLELSYAPPFGSAKDPVNFAGFVATNLLRGDVANCHVEEIGGRDDLVLLDVRAADEVKDGTIPGSVHIELDNIRGRHDELPRDKEIIPFCQVGLRGYLACRILSQKGYRCRNLSGGYITYMAVTGTLPV